MADYGKLLISKIVHEGDLLTTMRAGVKPNWFEDEDHKRVYEWMLDYNARYGDTPTMSALHHQFPNYKMITTGEPYDYYLDRFRDLRERSILVDAVGDAHEAIDDEDYVKAQRELSRGLLRIGQEINTITDENAVRTRRSRFDNYRYRQDHAGELAGIATGFSSLDFATGGFLPEQFVVYAGSQKQGKSFFLMKGAIEAQEQGNKILFISFEMSSFEQLVRYDAMCCGVSSGRLRRGLSSTDEMRRLKKGMDLRRNLAPFIVSTDISATTTVSGIAAKIDQHKPDIVYIDGAYLMENEIGAEKESAAAYTAISRSLKRLAQRTKIPVVASTQALEGKMGSSKKVTMHSLGYSSAWAQDADLILGVERIPDEPMFTLRIAGGRNVSPMEMAIYCNWEESSFVEVDNGFEEEE